MDSGEQDDGLLKALFKESFQGNVCLRYELLMRYELENKELRYVGLPEMYIC